MILGNIAQVPVNETVVVALSMRKEGTINENYGTEYYYLRITFQIGTVPIENEIFVAKGTDGYGNEKPINERLFEYLHKEGFHEEIKSHLANFLMDKYDEGEIKEEDIIIKMEEFFGIREV